MAWGNLDGSLKFLVFFFFVPIRNRYLSNSGLQFENAEQPNFSEDIFEQAISWSFAGEKHNLQKSQALRSPQKSVIQKKKNLVPMTTASTASIRKRKRASVSCVNSLDLLSSTNYEIYVQCLPSCLRKFSCSILNQRIYLYLKENRT